MNFSPLFQRYEALVIKADKAFEKMANDYSGCVKCERHCSDCCHAVFGLFLIEAAYLKHHFNALDRKERQAATLRGNKTDKDFEELGKKIKIYKDDPQMVIPVLSIRIFLRIKIHLEGQFRIVSYHRHRCFAGMAFADKR